MTAVTQLSAEEHESRSRAWKQSQAKGKEPPAWGTPPRPGHNMSASPTPDPSPASGPRPRRTKWPRAWGKAPASAPPPSDSTLPGWRGGGRRAREPPAGTRPAGSTRGAAPPSPTQSHLLGACMTQRDRAAGSRCRAPPAGHDDITEPRRGREGRGRLSPSPQA